MESNPRVFVSYASQDGKEFANKLRKTLHDQGISLWQDLVQMEGGRNWWHQIQDALENVEYLVLVATPLAMASAVVKREWREARKNGVCVYPILVPDLHPDFASMPRWMKETHFYRYESPEQQQKLVNDLLSTCDTVKVPDMSPTLTSRYVPRQSYIDKLVEKLLDETKENPLAITTALRGAGGFGKTTLAAAISQDEKIQWAFDDGILWVTLGKNPNLVEKLAKLYRALTAEKPDFIDVDEGSRMLAEKLENRDCLIVIDDVWDGAHLLPFLRGGERCARLVTTRVSAVLNQIPGKPIDVREMRRDESIRLLIAELDVTDLSVFRDLANTFGDYPLMLELINSAIREQITLKDSSVDDAVQYITKALARRGFTYFKQASEQERNQAISISIGMSLEYLEPDQQRYFYELAIFPEDIHIPLTTLQTLWDMDDFDTEDIVKRFIDLSLVNFDAQTNSVYLHDVIRSYIESQVTDLPAINQRLVERWGDPFQLQDTYAWHWLPYHMVVAGQSDELLELLMNFRWLHAKLSHTDVNMLLQDYTYIDDASLATVSSAIRLSAHSLRDNKSLLASQLAGRLLNCDLPQVSQLLTQIRKWDDHAWCMPLTASLTQPGDVMDRTLTETSVGLRCVQFSPDDKWLAAGKESGTLLIWNFATGNEHLSIDAHRSPINSVIFHEETVITCSGSDLGGGENTIKVWEIETGNLLTTMRGHRSAINDMAILYEPSPQLVSASGFAMSSVDNSLKFWSLDNHRNMRTLKEGIDDCVRCVTTIPDINAIVLGFADHHIAIWSTEENSFVGELQGHRARIHVVTVVRGNHTLLVSGAADSTIKIWDIGDNGNLLSTLQHHKNEVTSLAASNDGKLVVSGDMNGIIHVWDTEEYNIIATYHGHSDAVQDLTLSNDMKWLSSASSDGTLKLWRFQPMATAIVSTQHEDSVNALIYSPDEKLFASASSDGTLKLWDMATKNVVRTLRGHRASINDVKFSPSGEHLVSVSNDTTLRIWDVQRGLALNNINIHSGAVYGITFSTDGNRVISHAWGHSLTIWNTASWEPIRQIFGHADEINTAVLTKDNTQLVTGSSDRTIKIWDIESGDEYATLRGHQGAVTSIVILPDGEHIASADSLGYINIWHLPTTEFVTTLHQHRDTIRMLACAEEGPPLLISASEDRQLILWDWQQHSQVSCFKGESPLSSCAVSQSGDTLLVGECNGLVHILALNR